MGSKSVMLISLCNDEFGRGTLGMGKGAGTLGDGSRSFVQSLK
jgi:hypothetical protein